MFHSQSEGMTRYLGKSELQKVRPLCKAACLPQHARAHACAARASEVLFGGLADSLTAG
jgi:hypothetical protein